MAATFTDLQTGVSTPVGTVYSNTVTNWNNIYKNFEVKVSDLTLETQYYVYCAAEDDEVMEGATTILPPPSKNNEAVPILTEANGRYTLDLTPPIMTMVSIASHGETLVTVTLMLDEPGTSWCKAVRNRFDPPSINQIIAANFFSTTATANVNFDVQVENLERDTEYDVYCSARDRGTEEVGMVSPSAGNPGNDVTHAQVLDTKRDIHTMGDSTSPIVSTIYPVHQQINVDMNPRVVITFNEDVKAGSGFVTFESEGGVDIRSLSIANANDGNCIVPTGAAQGLAKIHITLTMLIIDFAPCTSSSLTANKRWYVFFVAGVLTDDAPTPNAVAAFGSSKSFWFTTTSR
jgi:hypothetical protein